MRTQLGAVAALTLAGLVLVPAPSEAATTCAGRTATIVGTDGDDVLRGTARADVISGGAGDDVILGLGGNDTLCGGAGWDRLSGNAGADRLYGGPEQPSDRDTLRGGPGDDVLVPGAGGNDLLAWDTAPRGVVVDLAAQRATGDGADRVVVNGAVSVVGSRYDDVILGSSYDDSIDGGAGVDRLSGRSGNDSLIGRPGANRLYGGTGDDFLGVDPTRPGLSTADGGAGTDKLHLEYYVWGTSVKHPVLVQLAQGTVRDQGVVRVRLTGLEVLGIVGLGPSPVATVVGSPGADLLDTRYPPSIFSPPTGSVVFRGYDGDDVYLRSDRGGRFEGGGGTDCLAKWVVPTTDVDAVEETGPPCAGFPERWALGWGVDGDSIDY